MAIAGRSTPLLSLPDCIVGYGQNYREALFGQKIRQGFPLSCAVVFVRKGKGGDVLEPIKSRLRRSTMNQLEGEQKKALKGTRYLLLGNQ